MERRIDGASAEGGRAGRRGDLDGLVALVTGGASGMGLAHACLMAARGARVAITDVSGLALEEAQARIVGDDVPRRSQPRSLQSFRKPQIA